LTSKSAALNSYSIIAWFKFEHSPYLGLRITIWKGITQKLQVLRPEFSRTQCIHPGKIRAVVQQAGP